MSFEEFPPGYKKRSIGFTTYIGYLKLTIGALEKDVKYVKI